MTVAHRIPLRSPHTRNDAQEADGLGIPGNVQAKVSERDGRSFWLVDGGDGCVCWFHG